MKHLLIILAFVFLQGVVSESWAKPVRYYLDKAFQHSPVLKARHHKALWARGNYKKESYFKTNPVFSVGYTNIPQGSFPALDKHAMSGVSIGLSQFFASPWESIYRKKKFYNAYLSEKESLAETKNLLAFQVQSLYHQIMFLYKKREILQENKILLKNVLKIAESLVSVNKMSSSQLLKLRADIATIENMIIEMDGSIAGARSSMVKLCGTELAWDSGESSKEQVKNWIDEKSALSVPAGFSYAGHPLFKKMQFQFKSYTAALGLERSKLAPGVTLGIEYRFRKEIPNDTPTSVLMTQIPKDKGENFISLKASIPIPLFYAIKDRHSISAAKEKKMEFKEYLKNAKLELQSRWDGESIKHKSLLNVYINSKRAVLPIFWAAYRAQIAALPSGMVSLIDVLDAYKKYLDSSLQHSRIYRDLMVSKLKLNYLLYQYPLKKSPGKETGHEKK